MYNPNPLIHQEQMAISLYKLTEALAVESIQIDTITFDTSVAMSEKYEPLTDQEIEARR